MSKNTISLTSLLDETVELRHSINCSHLSLQNFQIITPNNGRNAATMKYQQEGFSQKVTFILINMCRHEENICCVIINNDHNRMLFYRDLLLQDNGTVTIGTFMSIVVPHLIIQ